MSDEFLKAVKQQSKEDEKKLDMAALERLAIELAELQGGYKESFIDSKAFEVIKDYLHGYFMAHPPIKFLEDLLDYYKARKHQLEAEEIPPLLQAAGVKSVTFPNGPKLEIKEIVAASLVDENAFMAWAEANGCADILKVKFSIRKGEDLAAVRAKLSEAGTNYTEGLDKSGLAQSLGKLARDRIEAGQELPPAEALNVRIFEEVRLK